MLSTQPEARQICLAFLENVLSRETCLAMKSVRPIEFLHFWQVPQASPSYLSLLLVDPFKDPFWTYRFAESNKKQIKEAFIWGNFYDIADDEGVTLISAAPTDSLKPRSTLIFFCKSRLTPWLLSWGRLQTVFLVFRFCQHFLTRFWGLVVVLKLTQNQTWACLQTWQHRTKNIPFYLVPCTIDKATPPIVWKYASLNSFCGVIIIRFIAKGSS